MSREHDERYMREALKEARKALGEGEVPIGAVVVDDSRITGRGYNRIETLKDATAHAEIIAIGAASATRGDWRLEGSTLYVTVEPCLMCLGASLLARIDRLVFGTADGRAGACGGAVDIGGLKYMGRGISIDGGILEEDCRGLLIEFFSKLRQRENL